MNNLKIKLITIILILAISFFAFCTGGETMNNNENNNGNEDMTLDEMNTEEVFNKFLGTWSWVSEGANLGIIVFYIDDEGNPAFSIDNEIYGTWEITEDEEGGFWLMLTYEDGVEEMMQVTMDDMGNLILIDEAETMIEMVPVEEEDVEEGEVTLEQIESYIIGTWTWDEEILGQIMFQIEEEVKTFIFFAPEGELTGEWEIIEETGTGYYLYLFYDGGEEEIYMIILNDDGTLSLFDEEGEEIVLYPVE
jgi:hypothetical protein